MSAESVEPPLHVQVAANIRVAMSYRGLKQVDLARILDTTQQSVSGRMRGAVPFTVNEIGLLAGYLGMRPSQLVEGELPPGPPTPGRFRTGPTSTPGGSVTILRPSEPAAARPAAA